MPPFTYKDQRVRDLAWSLASPALLQPEDDYTQWKSSEWFDDISTTYAPYLRELDKQPDELHKWLADCNIRRLGSYFEKLWGFWLATNNRYRLLVANLPVRNSEKTIGEFDLLVEDTETGEHQHWELALKFYLGVGDLTQTSSWWGPMKRDRLDLKLAHMQTHQCRLSDHPESQRILDDAGFDIKSRYAIIKGRLFYPDSILENSFSELFGKNHLRGWWLSNSQFKKNMQQNHLYKILPKDQWLSQIVTNHNLLTPENLQAKLGPDNFTRPQAIAILQNGQEISRGFITPDDWSNSILSA